jgi:hypothetical protein
VLGLGIGKDPRKEAKMISKKNLDRVKYILTELKKTEKNCGACGQFFNKSQADVQGFHIVALCDATDEVCEDCNNGTDMPCVACIKEDEDKAWGISK